MLMIVLLCVILLCIYFGRVEKRELRDLYAAERERADALERMLNDALAKAEALEMEVGRLRSPELIGCGAARIADRLLQDVRRERDAANDEIETLRARLSGCYEVDDDKCAFDALLAEVSDALGEGVTYGSAAVIDAIKKLAQISRRRATVVAAAIEETKAEDKQTVRGGYLDRWRGAVLRRRREAVAALLAARDGGDT